MASHQVFLCVLGTLFLCTAASSARSVLPSAQAQLIGNSGHNPPSTEYGTSWILDVGMVTWSTSLIGRDTARGTIMGSSGQCSRSLPSGRITPEPPRPPCFQRLWPPPSLQSGIRSRPGRRGVLSGSDSHHQPCLPDTNHLSTNHRDLSPLLPHSHFLVLNFLCALT